MCLMRSFLCVTHWSASFHTWNVLDFCELLGLLAINRGLYLHFIAPFVNGFKTRFALFTALTTGDLYCGVSCYFAIF